MCVLDSEDLQQQITQKQISISTASANNQQQIETNQKKYDDAMETLNAGLNTELNTAQQNVNDAKRKVDHAQKDLMTPRPSWTAISNTELISAQSAYDTASTELGRAEKAEETAGMNSAATTLTWSGTMKRR